MTTMFMLVATICLQTMFTAVCLYTATPAKYKGCRHKAAVLAHRELILCLYVGSVAMTSFVFLM